MDEKTIQVNGAALHYVEQGSGQPLVFVHGSLSDYRVWLPHVRQFGHHFRAVAYSRRYHFPNIWTDDGSRYSAAGHAADLIALIEGLQASPAHVVANSFGAYTTLLAAARRPDLFRRLALGEPPILPWLADTPGGQPVYEHFLQAHWHAARRAFEEGDLKRGVRVFFEGIAGEGAFERLSPASRARLMDNAPSLRAEALSPDYFSPLTLQQLEQVTAPVLLMKGERSPRLFHLILDRLAECLPHARVVTIPGASHSMETRNPPAYYHTVRAFLEE